jgi:hypothetical protein
LLVEDVLGSLEVAKVETPETLFFFSVPFTVKP